MSGRAAATKERAGWLASDLPTTTDPTYLTFVLQGHRHRCCPRCWLHARPPRIRPQVRRPCTSYSLLPCPLASLRLTHPSSRPPQDYAAKVESAGLTWLGPRPSQILSMGLKHEARSAAINAGVPVLAGTALLTTLEDALEQARAIGFPVMLKASAGGGGMGMEVCESEEELEVNFEKTVGKALVRFLSCCFTLAALVKTACHLLFV